MSYQDACKCPEVERKKVEGKKVKEKNVKSGRVTKSAGGAKGKKGSKGEADVINGNNKTNTNPKVNPCDEKCNAKGAKGLNGKKATKK